MAGRSLALIRERPRLIVSLPQNDPELARAAMDGGADALKVHLNVTHDASGTRFGTLDEERNRLEDIIAIGLPVGIVPGVADSLPSRSDMDELARMGIDFFDLYDHDMPAWMTNFDAMTRTIAASDRTPLSAVAQVERLGFEMLEGAIIPHDGYGLPLSVADLMNYQQLRAATNLPIIVPTQRAIVPNDLPSLLQIGIDALMIGAIVTGRTPDSLRKTTSDFAEAISSYTA